MEIKKSKKADLKNWKLFFTECGFIFALLVVFLAFEWTSKEKKTSLLEDVNQEIIEEEMVPITQETPPPPPEVNKIPVLSDQIDIVDDEIKVDDNILNLEDDANLGVEIMDYVEAVEEEVVEEEAIPFQLVEEKPSFQGGDANEFSKWVNSRLVYPEIAKENGVQGRVMLQFTVNPNVIPFMQKSIESRSDSCAHIQYLFNILLSNHFCFFRQCIFPFCNNFTRISIIFFEFN